MRRGLTLGKFAPLHRGHQLVIETALAEMDEVVVLIYDCPETTPVPLCVRSEWLRALYPQVRVIEAWDGPTEVGDTAAIKQRHEEYLLRRLQGTAITHFFSSEFYGQHVSRALGAVDRRVDPERAAVPVSGTRIRGDPYAHRAWLHPRVYRDLVANVVFLGAPSTGKTTIAAALARRYDTAWMPEYGREYWERHHIDRRLTPEQLVEIAVEHLVREEALLRNANRFLFTDTNALTTCQFARTYHGAAAPELRELADAAASRYDLVFLCDVDVPYDDTSDRSGDVARQVFQKQIRADLLVRKIPFFLLRGDLETRMRRVDGLLRGYHKYGNVVDLAGCLL